MTDPTANTAQRVGPCISCGKSSPEVDFYARGNKCKPCVRATTRAWREANPERFQAARKAYRQTPEYDERRRATRANSPTVKAREERTAKQREWRERNAEKVKAWTAVEKALARGDLIRPDNCQECGRHKDEMQIQATHHDYSKPLDVEWLCVKCHRAKDAAMREEVVNLKAKLAEQAAEIDRANQRAEYWKAEHLAANLATDAAERAREEACGLLRGAIGEVRDSATDARAAELYNRSAYLDRLANRIAAFLAANGAETTGARMRGVG